LTKPGLRERKRQRTRTAILESARELFVQQGYHETSLAEVAERADIAISTLFGYFSAKADLFFADYDEIIADYIACITTRDRERESAIDATIRWHSELRAHFIGPETEWVHTQRRLINEDPALAALFRQRYEPGEQALTREVALDLGESPDDLRPRLIAAMKVTSYVTLHRYRAESDIEISRAFDEYVDECLKAATDAVIAVPTVGARRPRRVSAA